jgi:large subunit ribosomal protein L18
VVNASSKFVTAQLYHHQNGAVIEASTKEWAIKQQLYKTSDLAAYTNLARVFAQRCLESGIHEVTTKPYEGAGAKIEKFMKVLQENGLVLQEPPEINVYPDPNFNRYQGRPMRPVDWKEIVEHH